MVNYVLLAISVGLAIAGQIFMKLGMNMIGKFPMSQLLVRLFSIVLHPYVFIGLLCFGFSSIFWLGLLSRVELSYAYPMVSVAYVVVALVGYYFMNENVTLIRWLGIVTICFGVFLISRS